MPVIDAEHDEFVLSGGGRVYDFCSTSFQTSFGHSNQPIRQAIHDQLDRMPIASPKSVFQLKQIVTDELLELINIWLVPALVGVVAVGLAIVRGRRARRVRAIDFMNEGQFWATRAKSTLRRGFAGRSPARFGPAPAGLASQLG